MISRKNFAIGLLTASLFSANISTNAFAADKVVATYSGGKVSSSQVMKQFKSVLEAQPANQGKKFAELETKLQEALINGYVNTKLIEKEAIKLGITKSSDFKTKLKAVKLQLAQQGLIEAHLKEHLTDAKIDAAYANLADSLKGKKEVKTSHILVEKEEKSKEIRKKLKKGAKFSDMVKRFSKDEASKAKGGEIGYVTTGQLVPEYEKKAFSMKQGEISDPIKTQFGWHIIKMIDKRDAKVPTKEQASAQLKNKLSQEIIKEYFEEITKKANIKIK